MERTIAAISTPQGNGGIAVIRISGNDAVKVADKVFFGSKKLADCDTHTVHYGFIKNEKGEKVDEVLATVMLAPKTFTREDVVEISTHGGSTASRAVLDTIIRAGAYMAEPGEFTKRAFLNGRIDLSQAEAVIDIINSTNELAQRNALSQLEGSLSKEIENVRNELVHLAAQMQVTIDYPDEDLEDITTDDIRNVAHDCKNRVNKLLSTADSGKILRDGIKTVIVGKPNVGKSSLLNSLAREERAIVTDIAGTTRDVLEEQINLNGILLNIIDTAGIRDTEDVVEKIGVERAKKYLNNADLVIYVVDTSTALDENDHEIMELLKDRHAIVLLNKSDLSPVTTVEDIRKHLDKKMISISAKEQTGMDDLEETIKEMFFSGEVTFNDEVYITNIRHKTSLQEALRSLHLVLQSIADDMPEDFYSIDLMNAYEELGNIIGESVEDDLVNEIFSKFCMGK